GVSWLTKDWIASTRFTFGFRSTIRPSTRTIFAIRKHPERTERRRTVPLPEGEVGPKVRVRVYGVSGEGVNPHPPASPSTSPSGRGEGRSRRLRFRRLQTCYLDQHALARCLVEDMQAREVEMEGQLLARPDGA